MVLSVVLRALTLQANGKAFVCVHPMRNRFNGAELDIGYALRSHYEFITGGAHASWNMRGTGSLLFAAVALAFRVPEGYSSYSLPRETTFSAPLRDRMIHGGKLPPITFVSMRSRVDRDYSFCPFMFKYLTAKDL